jgi:hypothetical protein
MAIGFALDPAILDADAPRVRRDVHVQRVHIPIAEHFGGAGIDAWRTPFEPRGEVIHAPISDSHSGEPFAFPYFLKRPDRLYRAGDDLGFRAGLRVGLRT